LESTLSGNEFKRGNMLMLPDSLFEKLSSSLRESSIIFEPRPKNFFKTFPIVERELTKALPDWNVIRRATRSCQKTELMALLEKVKLLRQKQKMKEFNRIVSQILRVRKSGFAVQEIEDPEDSSRIVHEPDRLRMIFSGKYRNLFASDVPRSPFNVLKIDLITIQEI